jgi:hydroxyacylglutathione hydrolase
MRVVPIPVLLDNYAYLVISDSGAAAVVDPSEAPPVMAAAEREGVELQAIWNTHHHWDHVGGNRDLLLGKPSLEVYGYAGDRARIPGITNPVDNGEEFDFGGIRVRIIFIPAHTSGHIAFHLPTHQVVFTGDTLFAGGCGRLFEGDASTMVASLNRLTALPGDTKIFCGHEYTEKNLLFALTLEPGNAALAAKHAKVKAQSERREPTVPTTVAEELATNPFLRCDSSELRASIGKQFPEAVDDPVAMFACIRQLKDAF